jgi:hypothetical protein
VAHLLPTSYYEQFRSPGYEALAAAARDRAAALGIEATIFEIGAMSCSFPWDMPYVTWDGHLVPCCAKPFPKRQSFGTVLETSYWEARNSPAAIHFRERLLTDGDCPEFCHGCHVMEKTLFAR